MKAKIFIMLFVSSALISCHRNGPTKGVEILGANDQIVLNKKLYRTVITKMNGYKLDACDFYAIFSHIRSDSCLFAQFFVEQHHEQRYSEFFWAIQKITGVSSQESGGFFGPVYASDSLFYDDIIRWGISLNCVPEDKHNYELWWTELKETDLFRDTSFFRRKFGHGNFNKRFVQ